jgi:hypothetical protein
MTPPGSVSSNLVSRQVGPASAVRMPTSTNPFRNFQSGFVSPN